VIELGGRSLNCSPEAIELCGDKLKLAEHLVAHGLPAIPTEVADLSRNAAPGDHSSSWVIKPRDGAGSWLTFLIPPASPKSAISESRTSFLSDQATEGSPADRARPDFGQSTTWDRAVRAYQQAEAAHKALIQPFVAGEALSVGCLCHAHGDVDIFRIGRQRLSPGSFQYEGGTIPADLRASTVDVIEQLVRHTCAIIPGLRGYIGFDLILPDASPIEPLIVEINPRLTTSFVGYRQLCAENLAGRWLALRNAVRDEGRSPLTWKRGRINFDAAGEWKKVRT
jgi:tyramine---L-glutamate ligase